MLRAAERLLSLLQPAALNTAELLLARSHRMLEMRSDYW